ncbi:MAG TPA: hypothetical protein VN258_09845 [Mobilitalea sp.]|nr:hypothetical protein [Mobilitalea sp.]
MDQIFNIFFPNANSRETYFTIHNIKTAHLYGKGKGVKVGIIDWLFGIDRYKPLYHGFVDVTNSEPEVLNSAEHGYWMASVLKEIAPECEIHAINACNNVNPDEELRLGYLEAAIDWAIENNIDILTYSQANFSKGNINRRNQAIKKAAEQNIITTFIHCDSTDNLWPYGCYP